MVGNPDFLTQTGQDQNPELQELETPEGELFLRFFVTADDEFALPATASGASSNNPQTELP
jgi:purine-binding chemotaxis protein CheW